MRIVPQWLSTLPVLMTLMPGVDDRIGRKSIEGCSRKSISPATSACILVCASEIHSSSILSTFGILAPENTDGFSVRGT